MYAFAETFARLTEMTQYTCGKRCLPSGILSQILLKSSGLHSSHTKHQFFRHEEGVCE